MGEEYRAVKRDEMEECLDLWGKVFERVGRDYFVPYFRGDPWFDPDYTRVCSVDGRVVSAVQVCERKVRVGDAEIVMGGIGNVGTYPEFRGRGYSSHLLRDSVGVMREHGIDFSVLFTGIHPFYERIGWRSVPQKFMTGGLSADASGGEKSKYSIRQCDWASDLAGIERIHDVFNKGRPLTTVRTPEYWKGYALPRFGAPKFTLVAESDGEVAGYLHFRYDDANCWLREIGCLSGHEGCAAPLMREVFARVREAGVQTIWVNLPLEPQIVAGMEGVVERLETREPMGMMCRVINMGSLGERILPELNRRAKIGSIPSGSVSLDTEMGSVELTIQDHQVSLGDQSATRIPISQLEFFCLLFGIKSVEELGLSISEEAREAVSTLFPPQHPVFWLADHF